MRITGRLRGRCQKSKEMRFDLGSLFVKDGLLTAALFTIRR
jgi:hypothetical protein